MRCCIYTVWSKTNTNQIVILNIQIIVGRHTDRCILWKLHNTVVRLTNAELILCAEHTERLNTTDLATLDLELLVATIWIEHRAYCCTQHLQALTAVWCTADNLQRSLGTNIYGCNVEVIRVGMILTGSHIAYNNTLQATTNSLNLLELLYLKTNIGKDGSNLLGSGITQVDILF